MRLQSFSHLFAAMAIVLGVTNLLSADWTQWRGSNRDGHATSENWPDTLAGLSQTWAKEFGPSYSGPIVVGDHVYTTETKDKKFEVTYALNRKDGEQAWSTQWEGAMSVPFFAWANGSWIRSTPTLNDGMIYVAGMRDHGSERRLPFQNTAGAGSHYPAGLSRPSPSPLYLLKLQIRQLLFNVFIAGVQL